jgi:hypothetical protein
VALNKSKAGVFPRLAQELDVQPTSLVTGVLVYRAYFGTLAGLEDTFLTANTENRHRRILVVLDDAQGHCPRIAVMDLK